MAIRILKKSFIQTKNTYHKGKKNRQKPARKQSNRYWCFIFLYASLMLRILDKVFAMYLDSLNGSRENHVSPLSL